MVLRLVMLVCIVLCAAGCAGPYVRHVEAPLIPELLVKRIPLAIGVHYSSEFRSAQPTTSLYVINVTTFDEVWQLGAASVALFDAVLRGLFANVVPVTEWPPGERALPVSGVLVPSVPEVEIGRQYAMGITSSVRALDIGMQYRIRYRLDLYSNLGVHLGAWDVVGASGQMEGELSALRGSTLVRDAARSAAAGVIVSFFREPAARAWLEAKGVHPDLLR